MKIYQTDLLENTYILDEATSLHQAKFLDTSTFKTIENQLETLKRSRNLLIRLWFFILGCLMFASAFGFFSLFAIDNQFALKIMLFFYTIIGFFATEMYKKTNVFGNGLDDALVFCSLMVSMVFFEMVFFTNFIYETTAFLLTLSVLSWVCYFRYLHGYLILASIISIVGALMQINSPYLCFIVMLFGILLFFIYYKIKLKNKYIYYKNGLNITKFCALFIFYLAGNYGIIREYSNEQGILPDNTEIPLAWFFNCFMFIVPIIYLYASIKFKDRMLLWLGIGLFAGSIITFRTYHHVLPTTLALTLGGLILLALSMYIIKKFKNSQTGLSFMPDPFQGNALQKKMETLTTLATNSIETTSTSPMEFGGGGFSGGGSGSNF